MKWITKAVVAIVSALGFSVAQSSPVLQVSGGVLMGATGVQVGSDLYDVAFVDGSCNSLFSGCGSSSFVFHTQADALAASTALLAEVFVDGAAGNFDSISSLVNGCTDGFACRVLTPYGLRVTTSETFADVAIAVNVRAPFADETATSNVSRNVDPGTAYLWATWSLAQQPVSVPEPSTLALLGLSLAGVGMIRGRRKYRILSGYRA